MKLIKRPYTVKLWLADHNAKDYTVVKLWLADRTLQGNWT